MTRPLLVHLRTLAFAGVLALVLCFAALPAAEGPAPPGPAPATQSPDRRKSMIIGEGETLWDVFLKGGICMWPILACSIIGLAFFFERFIELRRSKHVPTGFDKEVVEAVDTRGVDAGLGLCLSKQSSMARVLYAALLRYGTTRQEMEAAIGDEGSRMLYDLRRNCRVIAVMCNMAPMWGLLGTVQGLIMAFDKVAAGGALGRTEMLAVGVAVALLTTAFGLLVAIPLLGLYHYARGRADDVAREIEERAVDVVVTLDRKARRSMRPLEDIEENLETKSMTPARAQPGLDAQLADSDLEKAIKTSVPTPAHLAVAQAEPRKDSGPGAAPPAAGAQPEGRRTEQRP